MFMSDYDHNTVILHLPQWLIPHADSNHFIVESGILKLRVSLLAIQSLVLGLNRYLLFYHELYVQLYMQ